MGGHEANSIIIRRAFTEIVKDKAKELPASFCRQPLSFVPLVSYFAMKSNCSYWPLVVTTGSMPNQRSAMVE